MEFSRNIADDPAPSAFAQGFGVFDYTNTVNKAVGFSVRLPSDWTAYPLADAAASAKSPITVLMTAHGTDRATELVIWEILMPREIHPADWLDGWLRSQSFQVLDIRTRKTSYGVLADVLASRTAEGVKKLHRFATVKDGNRLFLLDARTSTHPGNDAWMQKVFWGALTGFQLSNPTRERFAEPFAFHRLEGDVPLQFAASKQWALNVSSEAPAGGTAILYENRVGPTLLGTVILATSPRGNETAALEQEILGSLANNGITFDPKTATYGQVLDTSLGSMFARADARRGDLPLDMHFLRAGNQDVSAAAILVSPTRETNFEAWAINRRAFEILIDTLQPAD